MATMLPGVRPTIYLAVGADGCNGIDVEVGWRPPIEGSMTMISSPCAEDW